MAMELQLQDETTAHIEVSLVESAKIVGISLLEIIKVLVFPIDP